MVGARYALAISRHPSETHIPQPHPHTRYLIDRTLGHFENRYREDISVVSRAGIDEQLPETLTSITDTALATKDWISIAWNSLKIEMGLTTEEQQASYQTLFTILIIVLASPLEPWYGRSWWQWYPTVPPRLCLVQWSCRRWTKAMHRRTARSRKPCVRAKYHGKEKSVHAFRSSATTSSRPEGK